MIESITFETSINGSISQIPAWYTIEVPYLPVGTTFKVEERDSITERPLGYDKVIYERDKSSFLTLGEEDNAGIIRASDEPRLNVINQRGYEVHVKKNWLDRDFALGHDDIFVALYYKSGGVYHLADCSGSPVRRISAPNTEARFFMNTLENNAAFSGYEVFEVNLRGNYFVDKDGYVTKDKEGTPLDESDIDRITPNSLTSVHATDRVVIDDSKKVFTNITVSDPDNELKWSRQTMFNDGSVLYGDNNSIKAVNVPDKLKGAEYIRTADASNNTASDPLCTFTTGVDATIYVAIDSRLAENSPSWLNDWKKTDTEFQTTEIDPATNKAITMKLFRKDPEPEAGATIQLGPNGPSSTYHNYIVLGVPRYNYKIDCVQGEPITSYLHGGLDPITTRSDTITNIRQGGIEIDLYEMGTRDETTHNYGVPLKGGVFQLKKGDELLGSFTSDENGRITIMYSFERDKEYTIKQVTAPPTYIGLPKDVKFTVNANDTIEVSGNPLKWNNNHTPTVTGDQLVAYIDLYNKPFILKAVKVDSVNNELKLDGVHFEMYHSVNSVDGLIPDTTPAAGFEDLVTDENGVIPRITQLLPEGTYFLKEKTPKTGYKSLDRYIRFSISGTDVSLEFESNTITTTQGNKVTITANYGAKLIKTDEENQYLCELQIPNEKNTNAFYFNLMKTILVDKNIHGSDGDPAQKFVFKVERFAEDADFTATAAPSVLETFYVTLNCTKPNTGQFPLDPSTDDSKYELQPVENSDPLAYKVKVTYNGNSYTFPAAIYSGETTVKLNTKGIYRVTEMCDFSSTDYDFWNGSQNYSKKNATKGKLNGRPYVQFAIGDADNNRSNASTASFVNTETEYAYLSAQDFAQNKISPASPAS